MKVKITGVRELKKALSNITEDVAREVRDETNKAALNIESEAKRKTPVDTGRLRSSIHTIPAQSTDPETGTKTGDLEAAVATNVKYASYVEHGVGQQAQPF